MVAALDERYVAGSTKNCGMTNSSNSSGFKTGSGNRRLHFHSSSSPEREGMTTAGSKDEKAMEVDTASCSCPSSSCSSPITSMSTPPLIPYFGLPLSGHHRIGGYHAFPVPLGKARDLLMDAVRDMAIPSLHSPLSPPASRSSNISEKAPCTTPAAESSSAPPRFVRIEVPVSDILDEESALLWLRGQPERLMPRLFFRVPERGLVVAGVGAAHCVGGAEELGASKEKLGLCGKDVPAAVTYYGGGRFDPQYPHPSAEWQGFGTSYLVLPALELIRRTRHGDGPLDGSFLLALNLRFSNVQELQAGRTALLHLLRDVQVAATDGDDEGAGDALLPAPVSCEEPSQFDAWHEGVGKALAAMQAGEYRKVVLARAVHFTFPRKPRPLDLVLRLRGHYGYLFCLQLDADRAFLGCTPEQLFRVAGGAISTEALAGTRPRGQTPEEDEALAAELMASHKDRFENRVTAESIEDALRPLVQGGRVERFPAFVLRLQHVQHICHKITGRLRGRSGAASESDTQEDWRESPETCSSSSAFDFLAALHPTPAVAGEPRLTALQAIRQLEPFDRGFYAGPIGFLSRESAEFAVAIRSVLIVRERAHVFAGAGIVPGSTAEGEWAEIGAKMANFVRMFPRPSPPLRSLPNLATLWATLVVEELARNGVTHFVIAPGSRSTPLVTAAARHPDTTLMVHHDERGAGFYCLGYARARGRPAAVIVTSGTAVANLLPAAVEAATDRVPLLLLTADRPPEQRDCGANQTVAQPDMFLHFARWTKDVPCPTPEVLASSLLSDVDYAVSMARGADPGPVHLNFMLRENLAPEGGAVRDTAVPGLHSEWPDACLGGRRFAQWERSLQPYTCFPRLRPSCPLSSDLLAAIHDAQRGLLVIGRLPQRRDRAHIRWLAQGLRWPIFADMGSGLRCDPALKHLLVAPYESLLADPLISSALDPDVILQIGSPLVSKRLPKFMVASRAATLIHVVPSPARRDPELSATHHVCSDIPTFVHNLDASLDWERRRKPEARQSGLLSLLKTLAARIEHEIAEELGPEADTLGPAGPGPFPSSPSALNPSLVPSSSPPSPAPTDSRLLNEPMTAHLVARLLPAGHGLFLSNSMPVRDMETFATLASTAGAPSAPAPLASVAMNRGASGIDGILSSAMGYAAGLGKPVTLLVGDMACLHDLNALHALSGASASASAPDTPVTVVLVNNGGGGIFSFLPIARHADVFSPYFDSPHDLHFGPITQAFGLPYHLCKSAGDLVAALHSCQAGGRSSLIEVVTDRAQNVRIHRQLGAQIRTTVHAGLSQLLRLDWIRTGPRTKPTLLLLHGFLGCKEDWTPLLWEAGGCASASNAGLSCSSSSPNTIVGVSGGSGGRGLAMDYDCLAVDLPGHGTTAMHGAGVGCSAAYSMPVVAFSLIQLLDRLGIAQCAVMGYSLGGRLAMYLAQQYPQRISAMIIVSAHPGLRAEGERLDRREEERRLGRRIEEAAHEGGEAWSAFLRWWYSKPLWGRLAERSPSYARMMRRRRAALARSEDPGGLSRAFAGMSLAQQPALWDFLRSGHVPTLIVYGANDVKYAGLGEELRASLVDGVGSSGGVTRTVVEVKRIDDAGHAVLVEKEMEMLRETTAFLRRHLEDAQERESGKGSAGGGSGVSKSKGGPSASPASLAATSSSSSSLQAQPMRVASLQWTTCSVALKKPLVLSSGPPLTHRRVIILVLEAVSGSVGVGEASPLPGFSKESFLEAEKQVKKISVALRGRTLPKLGGSKGLAAWKNWLESDVSLLPSVRAGLEMALVHLLAQEYRVDIPGVLKAGYPTHLLHTGQVCLNGLVLRTSPSLPSVPPSSLMSPTPSLPSSASFTASMDTSTSSSSKIKVGGRPVKEDVARVNNLTAELTFGHRLRLDANQAWSADEAVSFIRGLSHPEKIEYLEEPCKDPLCIPEVHKQTEQRLRFALDESLACPPLPYIELLSMEGLCALVLKPTVLGGLKQCLALHSLGLTKGLYSVVSSSFESSIGLAHLALLAAVLNSGTDTVRQIQTAGVHVLHGLSTYDVFVRSAEEWWGNGGGFSRLVASGSRSVLVDVVGCEELLDGFLKSIKHNDGRWKCENSIHAGVEKEEEIGPERAGREVCDGKRNDSP